MCGGVVLAAADAQAQSAHALTLELIRPDAKPETLRGRQLEDVAESVDAELYRECGDLEIALRKVRYSRAAGFSYYFVVKPAADAPMEWRVSRDDDGRFASKTVRDVKVFWPDKATLACADFSIPLYCVTACSDTPWWTLAEDGPSALEVRVGATLASDLLFKRQMIELPVVMTNPALTITDDALWEIEVGQPTHRVLDRASVGLKVDPRWNSVKALLLGSPLTATLSYSSEINDSITEGVVTEGNVMLPVVLKLYPLFLIAPLILGTTLALIVRQLAWNNVRQPIREWWLTAIVASLTLFLLFMTGTSVEALDTKVAADGAAGALVVGLTVGLAGRRAVDELYYRLTGKRV